MTTRQPPAGREVSEGYELVAEVDPGWRIVTGKKCRRTERGTRCGQPSVAELDRGAATWPGRKREHDYWAYCPSHLYGCFVEDGQVWRWVLREKMASDA
jgi:hypothetical protein